MTVAILEVPKNFTKKDLGGNNGSARRKRFVKCGHLGFGQYCHRCQLADTMEKEGKEGKYKDKLDPKILAERVSKLRSLPGAVISTAPAAKVAVVKEVKEGAKELPKPRLTEKELALKGQQFNPMPSLGKIVDEKSELMQRINANAEALSEG